MVGLAPYGGMGISTHDGSIMGANNVPVGAAMIRGRTTETSIRSSSEPGQSVAIRKLVSWRLVARRPRRIASGWHWSDVCRVCRSLAAELVLGYV